MTFKRRNYLSRSPVLSKILNASPSEPPAHHVYLYHITSNLEVPYPHGLVLVLLAGPKPSNHGPFQFVPANRPG